jgi:hypothetical protein
MYRLYAYIIRKSALTKSLLASIPCEWKNYKQTNKQTNSVALSQQANYTDWATATCRRNLVSTFVDRGVSHFSNFGLLSQLGILNVYKSKGSHKYTATRNTGVP